MNHGHFPFSLLLSDILIFSGHSLKLVALKWSLFFVRKLHNCASLQFFLIFLPAIRPKLLFQYGVFELCV